jgi:hypothetical protein
MHIKKDGLTNNVSMIFLGSVLLIPLLLILILYAYYKYDAVAEHPAIWLLYLPFAFSGWVFIMFGIWALIINAENIKKKRKS